ncbi:hypothetical protein HMPREF0972_00281 [Actinomyces sp. oral taxon 848 str. F0332]|nr:hypothetical protein HMPREF0972_00281 [Actinomyces sp. oral taxon 848 str. F0332]
MVLLGKTWIPRRRDRRKTRVARQQCRVCGSSLSLEAGSG